MNKTFVIFITILICAALLFVFLKYFQKKETATKTIFCGPNSTLPVVVFVDPTGAFPSFAEEYNYKVSGSLSLLDSLQKLPEIKGSGSIDLSNKIVELRDKLSNESSRMEMILRANFLAFNNRPCDSAVSRKYYEVVEMMAEKNMELEKLKVDITKPESRGAIDTAKLFVSRDTSVLKSALESFSQRYTFAR
jgi:hypothetical protein